jgi:hypothetical protein
MSGVSDRAAVVADALLKGITILLDDTIAVAQWAALLAKIPRIS